jgi:hypothetical protein
MPKFFSEEPFNNQLYLHLVQNYNRIDTPEGVNKVFSDQDLFRIFPDDNTLVEEIKNYQPTLTGAVILEYIQYIQHLNPVLKNREIFDNLQKTVKPSPIEARVLDKDALMSFCLNNEDTVNSILSYGKPNMKDLGIKYIEDGALLDTIPPYPIKEASRLKRRMSISLEESGLKPLRHKTLRY